MNGAMVGAELEHVVVTGAGGFIGKALVTELCRLGVEVVAIAREPVALPCKTFVGDIEIPGLLQEYLTSHTTLFHMAAHANVAGSVRDPIYDFGVNVVGLMQVLESVRATGASMVFPSSAAVYDPSQSLPHGETARRRPSSPYAAAKIAGEAYCQAYHHCYQLNVKIVRLFNAYGPGMTRFAVRDFYEKIKRSHERLEILGDGSQTRDYLYIDDTVDALLLVAAHGLAGECYNLAAGVPVRTVEVARLVAQAMGFPAIDIDIKGQSFPGDVARWYADTTKLSKLGFTPKVSLEEGVRRTIAWFQSCENAPLQHLSERFRRMV